MPWEFKRSKRRLDAIAYRQAYKKWILNGGKVPPIPETLDRAEVIRIQAVVKRLYDGNGARNYSKENS